MTTRSLRHSLLSIRKLCIECVVITSCQPFHLSDYSRVTFNTKLNVR